MNFSSQNLRHCGFFSLVSLVKRTPQINFSFKISVYKITIFKWDEKGTKILPLLFDRICSRLKMWLKKWSCICFTREKRLQSNLSCVENTYVLFFLLWIFIYYVLLLPIFYYIGFFVKSLFRYFKSVHLFLCQLLFKSCDENEHFLKLFLQSTGAASPFEKKIKKRWF